MFSNFLQASDRAIIGQYSVSTVSEYRNVIYIITPPQTRRDILEVRIQSWSVRAKLL